MADDLKLLDNVELRFALAETDAQLEKTLKTFLCPVLLKLASPVEAIIGILTHINKRVRSKSAVQLPVDALLQQFSTNDVAMVRNFTLIYIEMGFERLPLEALSLIKQHNEDNTTSDPYGFISNPNDALCLLGRLQDVLLYRQPVVAANTSHQRLSESGPSSPLPDRTVPTNSESSANVPAGMSPLSVQQVTYNGKAAWASTSGLKNIKTGALRFICSTTSFPDASPSVVHLERFIALIGATGDAYNEVATMGEDGLKRLTLPDMENKQVVDRLFLMYQGSNKGTPIPGKENIFRSPSSNVVKLRIMGYLSKSKIATETFPSALQVSFDCLYGPLTNSKLIMAGMAFVQWTARMSSQASLTPIAPVLVSGLLKYTRENEAAVGIDSDAAKGFAYVAISLISKRVPTIFRKDLQILKDFFDHLVSQPPNVKTYIQESLCTMLEAFSPMEEWAQKEDKDKIIAIIEANISKEEHHARFCAVKYATDLFQFSDVASKLVCLLLIADEKLEIREEAKRGLTFPTSQALEEHSTMSDRSMLPDFVELVRMIKAKSQTLRRDEAQTRPTFGKSFIMGFSSDVFIHILQFFRRLLITSADLDVIIEESSNDYELQEIVFTSTTRLRVKKWLKDMWDRENLIDSDTKPLSEYISFLETALNHQGPQGLVTTDHLNESSEQRENFLRFFRELTSAVKDKTKQVTSELRHGSLLAVGFVLGRLLYRYPSKVFDIVPRIEFEDAVLDIVDELESKQTMLVAAACISLGEIGRYGVIPSKNTSSVIPKVIETAKDIKDIKTQESAITALGHIGVGNPESSKDILAFFYEIGPKSTKQTEVNFTIGEAIACIGAGWECSAMDVHADVADQEPPKANTSNEVLDDILNTILNTMATSLKAATKKAACIWLLSIVKFCSGHDAVKMQLPRLHAIFSSLLSDRDELTQEVASKGIGLVYDLGDQSMRAQLVDSLVGMFGDRKTAQKVTGETELFDGNALGQAPDGSSLSTYQSILSLASDMNQPELVYKFMHLASHNSMWQSRKGAAFGFSSIVSQAEAELKPHLVTLIPRLYRFQYDPNPKVNEAMTSIWRALVKEPKKAVQEYFDVIIKDLLEGMGARAWRTPMADLLQGRSVKEIEQYLENIWTMSFRALDDIKESVRVAAFKTCRALTLMTVKYCDPKNVTDAEGRRVLDIMVPFLLTRGLLSSAEEVSKFSLTTLLKICKQAGPLLRSHISAIIVALLEGLTSMEPQMMNYLSFHTDKYQVSQEQLESSRLNAAKLSPMMEGIEACVEHVDDRVIADLSDALISTIRKAVGLPTKAGVAHLLVSLCIKKPAVLRPHSHGILKVLGSAIKDKSPVVRKSYAVAVGYLCRLATDAELEVFMKRLDGYYLESTDDEIRSIAAITTREISKNASDRFKAVSSTILPTVFFGKFDAIQDINGIWKDVWEENTTGSSSAVKLYAQEIIELLSTQLISASWNAKKQSAAALKSVTEVMDLNRFMETLLPIVLDCLSGRTWEGKESVVELLPALAISSRSFFDGQQDKLKEIAKILLREAKKVNKRYRRHAIDALGTFLDAFDEIDFYFEVKTTLLSLIKDDDADEDDDDEHNKPLQLMVMASAGRALGRSWTRTAKHQAEYSSEFAVHVSNALVRNVWNVRSALLDSLDKFFAKLDVTTNEHHVVSEETILLILDSVVDGALKDFKYIGLRIQGLDLVKAIIAKIGNTPYCTDSVLSKVKEVLLVAKKDPVPSVSEAAATTFHSGTPKTTAAHSSSLAVMEDDSLVAQMEDLELEQEPVSAHPRLLFTQPKVFVKITSDNKDGLPGFLSLIETVLVANREYIFAWTPEASIPGMNDDAYIDIPNHGNEDDSGTTFVAPPRSPDEKSRSFRPSDYEVGIPLQHIYSLLAYPPKMKDRYGSIIVNLIGGESLPAFYFHDEGSFNGKVHDGGTPSWGGQELLSQLETLCDIVGSAVEPGVYLMNASEVDKINHGVVSPIISATEPPIYHPLQTQGFEHPHHGLSEHPRIDSSARQSELIDETSAAKIISGSQAPTGTSSVKGIGPITIEGMQRRRSLSESGQAHGSMHQHGLSASSTRSAVGTENIGSPGRPRTPLPFEQHIDPLVITVKEMRWNILERFSQVARFSRETATTILDHPITKQILPPHVQQRIQDSDAAKRVMDDYDSARVYLAKWAATVADQGDRERRELEAMGKSHSNSPLSRACRNHANDKRRINDHEDEEGPLGTFNVLDLETECAMIHHSRTEPLSPMEWFTFFDEQGRLLVPEAKVREVVFRGGIDHDIRIQVWKFFLGIYPWDSTEAERVALQTTKTEEYFALKRVWFDSAAVQESEAFQEQKLRIEKDVHRTDRTISFFASETLPNPTGDFTGVGSNENLELLKDILLTYNVWAEKHSVRSAGAKDSCPVGTSPSPLSSNETNLLEGYVQGMSDLLAPVFAVMGDEVMGFWAFVGLMEKTKKNFYRDQVGMQSQLETLGKLIQTLDPKLYAHLEKCEALNLFFCFRWLLIWFKREFEWVDIMRLWEVLFSDHLSSQFHLFVAMAILDKHRDIIMDHLQGFDEILKYVNDLSMTIDLEETLQDAEVLYRRLKNLADKIDSQKDNDDIASGSTDSSRSGPRASSQSLSKIPDLPASLRRLLMTSTPVPN
ncbi:hypothetical protein BGZ94_007776 [Podila epigama]|nr:hypothetical protein BGZ94_007776 [Podila epigama]